MSCPLHTSLAKLANLTPEKLHQTNQRIRKEQACAEWKMAVCLLASERRRLYHDFGYRNIYQYAETELNLSGQKTTELLSAARILEHLPAVSEAFRDGRLGWAKVRALKRVATPETEEQWLDFALAHRVDKLERKIALSPTEWKRAQALQASLAGKPTATPEAVEKVLSEPVAKPATDPGSEVSGSSEEAGIAGVDDGAARKDVNDPNSGCQGEGMEIPGAPKKIRVEVYLTPDQYAVFSQAESRIRADAGKRLSMDKVVTRMAQATLDRGDSRARARHQVIIHHQPETGLAWYDTDRGPLPVSPEVLDRAGKERPPISAADLGPSRDAVAVTSVPRTEQGKTVAVPASRSKGLAGTDDTGARAQESGLCTTEVTASSSETEAGGGRKTIPNHIIRALHARASDRCEDCGVLGGALHIHHVVRVSDGGLNRLETLKLLCPGCHQREHELDFATRPGWRFARDSATSVRKSQESAGGG